MSKKPNIVQLTNDYIDNANQEQRLERTEHEQRNRFMGWILFVVVLLFILPTYNLVEYQTAREGSLVASERL